MMHWGFATRNLPCVFSASFFFSSALRNCTKSLTTFGSHLWQCNWFCAPAECTFRYCSRRRRRSMAQHSQHFWYHFHQCIFCFNFIVLWNVSYASNSQWVWAVFVCVAIPMRWKDKDTNRMSAPNTKWTTLKTTNIGPPQSFYSTAVPPTKNVCVCIFVFSYKYE